MENKKKKSYYFGADDLDGVKKVIWRNKVYDVGNRRTTQTELWQDGKLIRIVNIASCKPYNKSFQADKQA